MKTRLACLALSLCAFQLACDDGGGDDTGSVPDAATVLLPDAEPPDAAPPDAFVCTQTECGTACVDITSDPLNCNGCGLACDSAAQDCNSSMCECPANFVPDVVSPIFDQVSGSTSVQAIAAFSGSAIHGVVLVYDPAQVPLATEIDLATSQTAGVGLIFEIDPASTSARAIYFATSGTLQLSQACTVGVTGVVTGATFVESDMNGMPVPDGCSLTGVTFSFDIGDPCPTPGMDAGI